MKGATESRYSSMRKKFRCRFKVQGEFKWVGISVEHSGAGPRRDGRSMALVQLALVATALLLFAYLPNMLMLCGKGREMKQLVREFTKVIFARN